MSAPPSTGADRRHRPRLLIVALATSVHTVRYLDLLRDSEWELHVFDVLPHSAPHGDFDVPMTLHLADATGVELDDAVTLSGDPEAGRGVAGRAAHLARVIDTLRPDVIHAHEIGICGALTHEARELLGGFAAPWLVTNWGSDLLWNGRSPAVATRLRRLLRDCDYYAAECHRDVALARAFGFRGEIVGVWPVAGGIDADRASVLRSPGPPSARRAIALKGVAGSYGRVDVALRAIERCGDQLGGWELCGYQMDPDVAAEARAVAQTVGMRFTLLSSSGVRESPHDAILAMHGRSRIAIGLNRTDGISTSFLEAIVMGALPIQGHGSCGYELTPPGRGALFVDARDVDGVTDALRRAITDDALVDGAAAINAEVVRTSVDRRRIAQRVLDGYERIISERVGATTW